ncbi:zinc finger CW-type PWWP domain protein 1 [Eptesicus fuscus]|uniref:zinc finger CW-type PWWP domain protein 1 n=1 Tax=Eptesicus fuscus TaxID=29078 RepID=UPI002403A28A|nr:zinc finger CW-type PWWP domain protein 1 [Eptesicus fuscus]
MPYSPNSHKEETMEISSLEAEAGPNLAEAGPNLRKAKLEKKEEEATTVNGPCSDQEKKVKVQDNKQAEKKAKEKSNLTNEEFEEIVQIVIQKSLQECLETSCAQPIRRTQLDKEPGISSTTDNDNADREWVTVPHILEISASQEDGIIPEIKISKPGQPGPASSEKKFSKLSIRRRKKKAQDEKIKKAQRGHEHKQKDQPMKMVQGHAQMRDQQKGEESGFGQCLVWVQCSSPNCEKWRRLRGNIDPSVLPDNWSCVQNTDLEYNRCDIPEETWIGHESDVAYASYIPGSIIWAKQYGYPWWPGMVESDPDLGEYFLFASHLDSLPSKYHVTFFGETVSRAWIPVNMLKNFQELSLELSGVKKCRNKDCSQQLGAAMIMAQEAEQIGIQERVKLFGFWSRYSGSDNNGEGKDLMLSGAKSPDSFLEKEEEESDLEKEEEESDLEKEEAEEEEKKDPTLPSPRPAKIQTKTPKARGIADGRDGTQQGKSVKRSLGNEPAAAPVLIMGKKKVHGNSDPDQPGPEKKFKAPQSKALVTSLSEEKEVIMVPEGLILPAHHKACPATGKEEPGPQELQEAGSFPPDDEASSDLDLEQLMEDVGENPEQRAELQHRDDMEEFIFFEE